MIVICHKCISAEDRNASIVVVLLFIAILLSIQIPEFKFQSERFEKCWSLSKGCLGRGLA